MSTKSPGYGIFVFLLLLVLVADVASIGYAIYASATGPPVPSPVASGLLVTLVSRVSILIIVICMLIQQRQVQKLHDWLESIRNQQS